MAEAPLVPTTKSTLQGAAPPAARNATVGYEKPARPVAVPVRPGAVPVDATGATIGFGDAAKTAVDPTNAATDVTMAASGSLALDATVAHDPGESRESGVALARSTAVNTSNPFRTTVLPRVELVDNEPRVVVDGRARYETLKKLGEGGVGEVALAVDHDIDRQVAIKRLRPEHVGSHALIRFADEVRTVGKLEHPNIVPVHDVGLDEQGQHFFVMKYVDGETLETIIDKITAGDPAYLAKYTYDFRVKIFLGILHAIQYAHAQGVIHRDIKPANVMVGRFGEVMVMDWGLAKRIRGAGPTPGADADATDGEANDVEPANTTEKERLFRTRHGALLGTPAYMSPEQARGLNAKLDERSDVYSLAVLFHELVTGRHYLADCKTVPEMLISVQEKEFDSASVITQANRTGAPAELLWFVVRGLAKDPEKRFQSVDAMIQALNDIGDGKVEVNCPITLIKRSNHEVERALNRYPNVMMGVIFGGTALVLFQLGSFVYHLVR